MTYLGMQTMIFGIVFYAGFTRVRAEVPSCSFLQTGVCKCTAKNCTTNENFGVIHDKCKEALKSNEDIIYYRSSDGQCADAKQCKAMGFNESTNTWIHRYTCHPVCASFEFTIGPFSTLLTDPTHQINTNTFAECIFKCLETIDCHMVSYNFVTKMCIFNTSCGSWCSVTNSIDSVISILTCTQTSANPYTNAYSTTTLEATSMEAMQSSTTITTMFPVTTSAVSIHAHSTSVYVESSSPSPTSVNPTTNAMPPTTEVTTLMTAMPSLTTSANIFPVTTSVTPTQDRSASVYIEPSTYAGSVDPTTNAVPPTTSVTTSMTAMPSLTTPRHPEMLYIMPCICYPNKTFAGMTQEQIIQHLIAQTKINLKETHAAKNRLISRSDTRASSRMIGIVGTIVLVLVFGTVVLFDAISLWQKWCCFRKASFRVSDNP